VMGGAAGAIPTLSGWAAASGHLGLGAVFLFSIVFLWTPPHFWALALLLERQYAAAGVPMMPVVRGARATARQVLAYSIVLVALTLAPWVLGTFGLIYLGAALALGECSSCSPGACGAMAPWRAPASCFISRCSTSRCCS